MLINIREGIWILKNVFSSDEATRLKAEFFELLSICGFYQRCYGGASNFGQTVHHVFPDCLLLNEVITSDENWSEVGGFFDGRKFVLNSLGGNNNVEESYASKIHRDVRFFSIDKLMLNSIICLSPLNDKTGGTEFFNGDILDIPPSVDDFQKNKITIEAEVGDIVYFDSRIWHRAGDVPKGLQERVIYTPIYSRSFIKPGFDYMSKVVAQNNTNICDERVLQLASYYSAIPSSYRQWYDQQARRFYHKDQD